MARSNKPEQLRDSTDYIRLAKAEAKRLKRAAKLMKLPPPTPSVLEIDPLLNAADPLEQPRASSGRVRKWAEFELVFDYPATEKEAVDTATKHLTSTAVWVHYIRVSVPGIERVAGEGTRYTWKFLADVEFLPIDAAEMDAPTIYGLDGRPL